MLTSLRGRTGRRKTTFAREFLPNYANCKIFVNADLIAQGMAPFSPESAAFRAGRLMLEEIAFHAARGVDFGFETTLAGKGHLQVVRGLKARGYAVHIFYLWVPSAELALSRVRDRVLRGGHNISEVVVRRRFERSIRNFLGSISRWRIGGFSSTTPVPLFRSWHPKRMDSFALSKVGGTMRQ